MLQYIYQVNGQTIQDLTIIPTRRGVKGTFAYPCQPLCGFNLRRPHLTDLACRIRRSYYTGRTRRRVVSIVFFQEVPTAKWKHAILKNLRSLYFFVANL